MCDDKQICVSYKTVSKQTIIMLVNGKYEARWKLLAGDEYVVYQNIMIKT